MRPISKIIEKKICRRCNKTFIPRDSFDAKKRKFCSPKCYTDAKFIKRKKAVCRFCLKEFERLPKYIGRFCSINCFYQHLKKSRLGKKNPNFRSGIYAKGGLYEEGSKTSQRHLQACTNYRRAYIRKNGFVHCEVCGVTAAFKFSVHHIYYASRFPKHPHLHDDRNLILLCAECHRKFHASEMKDVFSKLEKERRLKQLFDGNP